ncbi:hypothetical protein AC1031_011275 [Aphanomyces cochlioides]|nr:hypothetical protein AC1031_011275 [Aphanomyces cochlioides]
MHRRGVVLLVLAAMAQADLTLTLCPSSNGVTVPCLNDTSSGNTMNLELSSEQSYDFTNLNITAVQELPPDARYIDLSFNRISAITRYLPSSLTFLNLSHNVLSTKWIQAPITVSTLDVSYNQGGLEYPDVMWYYYLPKLKRLVFRGNNLTNLYLGYETIPNKPHPFVALDVSDNPSLLLTIEAYNFDFGTTSYIFTADRVPYDQSLQGCRGYAENLVSFESVPVDYLGQGYAKYDYAKTHQVYVCIPPMFEHVDSYERPSMASIIALIAVSSLMVLLCLAFGIVSRIRKRRQREQSQREDNLVTRHSRRTLDSNRDLLAENETYYAMPVSTRERTDL